MQNHIRNIKALANQLDEHKPKQELVYLLARLQHIVAYLQTIVLNRDIYVNGQAQQKGSKM